MRNPTVAIPARLAHVLAPVFIFIFVFATAACDYGLHVVDDHAGVLAPATGLAVDVPRDGTMVLTWTTPKAAQAVRVLRKVDAAPTSEADPAAKVVYEGNDARFVDADGALVVGTKYVYAAFALYGPGKVAAPDVASAVLAIFAAPTSVTASEQPDGSVVISWTAPDPLGDVVTFDITRDGSPAGAAVAGASATLSYVDPSPPRGVNVTYGVASVDDGGAISAATTATIFTAPFVDRARASASIGPGNITGAAGAGDGGFYVAGELSTVGADRSPRPFGGVDVAVSASCGDDGLVAKLGAAGDAQWVRSMRSNAVTDSFGDTWCDANFSVVAADSGGLVAAGTFSAGGAVLDVDGASTRAVTPVCTQDPSCNGTGAGYDDLVVARYDANGALAWATTAGVPNDVVDEAPFAIAALPDGGAVVAGVTTFGKSGDVLFVDGTNVATFADGNSAFVFRVDGNGHAMWGRTIASSYGASLAALPGAGNAGVVVVTADTTTAVDGVQGDSLALGLDANDGHTLWGLALSNGGAMAAAVRSSDVVLSFSATQPATLTAIDGTSVAIDGASAHYGIALATVSSDGVVTRASTVVDTPANDANLDGPDLASRVFVAPDDSLLVAGSFSGAATFGAGARAATLTLPAANGAPATAIYLARFDPSLALWSAIPLAMDENARVDDAVYLGDTRVAIMGELYDTLSLSPIGGPDLSVPVDPVYRYPSGFLCVVDEVTQ